MNMIIKLNRNFLMLLALVLTIGLTSCDEDDTESTEQGERNEGNQGEGGNEQGESGTKYNKDSTADETINGIRAIITFNASTNTFEGTFENLNTNVAQQTRLEVHVVDANGNVTEFGPTSPVDMKPKTTRNISLPITAGTSFVQFSMHPEVGTAGSGG